MGQLGAEARRLRAIEIIRPSLDSVHLALTQRRYSSGVFEAPAGLSGTSGPVPTAGVPV